MLAELEAILTHHYTKRRWFAWTRGQSQCSSFTWRAFKSVQGIQITFLIERRFDFGDVDLENNQLRPHIVWFWRRSPCAKVALNLTAADYFVVIGTVASISCSWFTWFHESWNALFYIDPKLPIKIPNLRNTSDSRTSFVKGMKDWKAASWADFKTNLNLPLKVYICAFQ
jgi:hypothetical protein